MGVDESSDQLYVVDSCCLTVDLVPFIKICTEHDIRSPVLGNV
jgi:hypothetical protein